MDITPQCPWTSQWRYCDGIVKVMFVSFRSIYCLLITQVLPATVKPALWKIQLSCWKHPWSPFRASVSFFLFNFFVSSLLVLVLLVLVLVLVLFIFNIYFQETTTDIFLLSMNRDGRPLAGLESDNRNREEVSVLLNDTNFVLLWISCQNQWGFPLCSRYMY